jgi:protocatechuate 3,4-dioxygenase, beta subunit
VPRCLSRRKLLIASAALGSVGLVSRAFAAGTPELTAGPFYPSLKPLDQDADLTWVEGREGRARGRPLHISGRVLDARGEPLQRARVEIWQTDSFGRYRHPLDSNPAPADPDFQGYGVEVTDEEGRYRFRTVRPAPYPMGQRMRTPHVHFLIARGDERKTTQMFFPDEALNATDRILGAVPAGERRLLLAHLDSAPAALEAGSTLAIFDIIFARS